MNFNWLKRIFKRNYAISSVYEVQSGQPYYSTFTVENAVSEGIKKNVWVYRAVQLIAKTASGIQWYVADTEGKKIEKHSINLLLEKPNPFISKNDLFELLITWLELAGSAYLLKAKVGKTTKELWPISPDRIAPIPSKNIAEWIAGYAMDGKQNIKYQPEEIIHFRYFDPSNPLKGISPLEVASKLVDLDTAQVDFNTNTMQKKGVVDHIYTFEREFLNQDEADLIAKKLEEKQAGKRGFIVLGNNAKYQKIASTPAELDFINTRIQTRNEILSCFGVDPKLVGAAEASTYNNLETAKQLLWNLTIIPMLDDLADALNLGFQDELQDNQKITYDSSQIPASQEATAAKVQSGKILFDIGIPVSQINRIYSLNIEEYQNWDKPYNGATPQLPKSSSSSESRFLTEFRGLKEDELKKISDNVVLPKIQALLDEQKRLVFKNIGLDMNVKNLVQENFTQWVLTYDSSYRNISLSFANSMKRDLIQSIDDYLESEKLVLTECSQVNLTTVESLIELVTKTLETGGTIAELQQAIYVAGLFEPSRALMLARTLTGTAANLGQWIGAKETGATHKRWLAASNAKVRNEHKQRSGELVKIDDRFSPKFGMSQGPRFPLDNNLVPADRVNCRCSMTFERL